jgi:peptidoglycan/xylan/chitin deacetylase (PgdA/CDA1 family)
MNLKEILKRTAYSAGYPKVRNTYRKIIEKQNIFIMMYHRIDDAESPLFEPAVHPLNFEKQIRYFRKHFVIISLENLANLDAQKYGNKDIVIITFDDGYRDNYLHAFPILKKYGIPATIFLVSGLINTKKLLWYDRLSWILQNSISLHEITVHKKIDLADYIDSKLTGINLSKISNRKLTIRKFVEALKKAKFEDRDQFIDNFAYNFGLQNDGNKFRAMLNWNEVREMEKAGICFGAHTVTHPVLSQLDNDKAEEEIVISKQIIENKLQKPVSTFAYPYGKYEDFISHNIDMIKSAGYAFACTTNRGMESMPIKEPYLLKRRGAPNSGYIIF